MRPCPIRQTVSNLFMPDKEAGINQDISRFALSIPAHGTNIKLTFRKKIFYLFLAGRIIIEWLEIRIHRADPHIPCFVIPQQLEELRAHDQHNDEVNEHRDNQAQVRNCPVQSSASTREHDQADLEYVRQRENNAKTFNASVTGSGVVAQQMHKQAVVIGIDTASCRQAKHKHQEADEQRSDASVQRLKGRHGQRRALDSGGPHTGTGDRKSRCGTDNDRVNEHLAGTPQALTDRVDRDRKSVV